jgi:hypothetical protein
MSYKRAIYILPNDLLEQVQEYIDGEFIYIPRKSSNKKEWGAKPPPAKNYNNEICRFMKIIWREIVYKNYPRNIFCF